MKFVNILYQCICTNKKTDCLHQISISKIKEYIQAWYYSLVYIYKAFLQVKIPNFGHEQLTSKRARFTPYPLYFRSRCMRANAEQEEVRIWAHRSNTDCPSSITLSPISHQEALPWRVKSSGVRQSKLINWPVWEGKG